MDNDTLVRTIDATHADWFTLIEDLGTEGLERPAIVGDWRARDVIAHANCWDRWQLVQLRCAFTGDTPTDAELHGPITFPPNDDMAEDAMNAMFLAGYAEWSTDDVVAHFGEICDMRSEWVANATQDHLDAVVGPDWAGGTNRVIRLASEVEGVADPQPAWRFVMNQVDHLRAHLSEVRDACAKIGGWPPAR